jgi:type II secretory pathway pseudopilin PulG
MNKQKGFTLVEGLLIVLILSVVGFAGFTVWNNQQSDEAELIETSQIEQKNNEQAQETVDEISSIPDGWVLYEDETYGFSFIHPETWGELSAVKSDQYDGVYYGLSFSENDVYGSVVGSDRTYVGSPRGGGLGEIFEDENFSDYVRTNIESERLAKSGDTRYSTNIFGSSDNHITTASADCTQGGVAITATYNLTKQNSEVTMLRLATLEPLDSSSTNGCELSYEQVSKYSNSTKIIEFNTIAEYINDN